MKTVYLVIYVLFLCIMVSCRQQTNISPELLLADELMDIRPDSSLEILQSIHSPEKLASGEEAMYALLLTKAYYKNRIPVETDSLIRIAAAYFLPGNDFRNKAYTCYYLGRINQKNKNPEEAWKYYNQAAETAEKTDDYKLIKLIYNHWGILCFEQELYEESLEQQRELLKKYGQERKDLKEKLLKMEEIIQKIDQIRKMSIVQKIKTKEQIVLSFDELNNLVHSIDAYYEHFTKRLQDKYEKLTVGDIHICCLLKMEVSSGDIAILLNTSDSALIKRKYRIKKEKIGLKDDDMSLEEFLRRF